MPGNSRQPRAPSGAPERSAPRTGWARSPWLPLVPALILYLIFALRFYHHMVDDAFISFRYARNLADGHGLVFNPGERVEGYTNFLWVLLLELGLKLRLDPETVARLLGLAAGGAVLAAVVRAGAERRSPAWIRFVAPTFLAVHPAMAVWAVGGMETTFFAALVTWGVCLAALDAERGVLRPISAVLLALAGLTRPEGALFAFLVAAFALLPGREPRPSGRNVATWGAIFLVLWLPYFLWRWSYYGYIFPNTFYAKVDPGGSEAARGLGYLHGFLWNTGYWLLLVLIGLAWAWRRRSRELVFGVAAVYFGYVVFIGGDGLPMYRFFVPVLGLFFLLVQWGLEELPLPRRGAGAWAAALALIACAAWSARPNFAGFDYEYVRQDQREVSTWKTVGRWFRQNAAPGDSIAVLPAGAMPYFSGLKTFDMLGLNDVKVAHMKVALGGGQAGHEKYSAEYILRRSPTYVVVGVYHLLPEPLSPAPRMVAPSYPIERELLMSDAFHRQYRDAVAKTPGGYFLYFTKSRTSP